MALYTLPHAAPRGPNPSLDLRRGIAAARLADQRPIPLDELWIGLAEGPEFDEYASGSGLYAEQALRRLSDRLRERRGPATG